MGADIVAIDILPFLLDVISGSFSKFVDRS